MNDDDSTDWLPTAAPYLLKFEDNLRCPICREILIRAPTITECGHTFCGECIMRHFNTSEHCPVCRTSIQRGKLRSNKVVSDLTDLWRSGIRQSLLDLAQKTDTQSTTSASSPVGRVEATTTETVEIVSDSDTEQSPKVPEGHAQCPVCYKVLPIAEIQTSHIAKCLKQASSSSPSPSSPVPNSNAEPPAKRQRRAVFGEEYPSMKLAVPHFHSMSDTKLKNKAKEAGLSIKGNRQRIISRYMEWLTIWNASVGDKHPRTINSLRKHMLEWEKVQDRISEGSPSLKDLDAEKWSNQNNSSFNALIEQARSRSKSSGTTP